MESEPRYIRRRYLLSESRVLCVECQGYMATADDFLCDGCAFERTGLAADQFRKWREIQELADEGLLVWRGPVTREEALDVAEAVVREVFGEQEVYRVSEFNFNAYNDVAADWDRPFISKEDKKDLAKSGDPFVIVGARKSSTGNFGPQVILDIDLDNDTKCSVSFSEKGAGSREAVLAGMVEHFANSGEPIKAKLNTFDTGPGRNPGYGIVGV